MHPLPKSIAKSMDTAGLNDANHLREELDLMGYVISHDLQAPLRSILSTYEELAQHPGLQDENGKAMLGQLSGEAQRLKTMMQGLLEYVRMETFFTKSNQLDANELVDTAITTLDAEIKANDALVTHDVLPQVMGHRGRLTRLFGYLIDNAIKFHGVQPPEVRITAQRQGAMWEFCVSDNGIGIDDEHQDIIFRLFQRLHTAEEYPGYGIGLALARKIAEAHGGQLRVESAPQEGSRFRVTLPAVDNVKNNGR